MKVKVNISSSDCSYKFEVICPFCGNEYRDSWELPVGEDELDCGACGRTFIFSKEISVNYSSYIKSIEGIDWKEGAEVEDGLNEEEEEWANKNGKVPCEVVK